MPKKFTNNVQKADRVKKNRIRLSKNTTFLHYIFFPPLHKLLIPMFLAVLFLFPLNIFSRPLFFFLALLLSLYVLIALCLRLPALLRAAWQQLFARFWKFNRTEQWVRLTLLFGLLINLFYAVFRTVMGLKTHSLWFLAESVYYMGLCTARFWVAEADPANERSFLAKSYVRGGKLLLILSFSAIGTVTLAVGTRHKSAYPDLIVWSAALFAFWRLCSALFRLLRFHHRGLAIPLLAKAISLSAAAVSLFGFQNVLLIRLGASLSKRTFWNTVSGLIVCISLPVMALILLLKGRRMEKDR